MPRFNQDGMKVLNVAEKNDAAKSLSQIMSSGRSVRREGFSKFNKIYEFPYHLFGCNCEMIMTSVSGHLIDLDFTGGYKKWNQCEPAVLFEAPIARFVPENFQNIKRTLEREVRKCQALVIWTDGDREGENIGFEIIEVCRQVKPNIQLYRAKFSEITPRAVNIACQNLVAPDENASNAVEVRRELDLRIGAAFTRFQTLRLSKRFPGFLADKLISYGSCQFPTLGFVVERYKQVQEFISETFYKLKGIGKISIKKVAHQCESNDEDSRETLHSGMISYPRTETNIFPKGMNLTSLVEQQTVDPVWGAFATGILQDGGPNPRQGKKTDNAHPPIHPTKHCDNLQGNEKRVYELIVRHFLACVSKDAQGQETIIEIDIASEKFSAQGLVILARNYLDVYCYENWTAKSVGLYQQGETFNPDVIEMVSGDTRAPPLLSEADLIGLMEKHGIGTDATHAEHIETIKTREYVGVQNDGTFLPGQLGMGLVEGYDAMGFAMSKPHLRAALEEDLKCICEGRKRKDDVLSQQVVSYRQVFLQASAQVEKLDSALSEYFGQPQQLPDQPGGGVYETLDPVRKCPKCKQDNMVVRKTKEGSWLMGCMSYPNCRNSIFFPKFVLNLSKAASTCSKCGPQPVHKLEFEFKRGSVPPMMGSRYTGCVGGCDEMLNGILNVQGASTAMNQQTTNRRDRPELSGGSANHVSLLNRPNQSGRGNTRRGGSNMPRGGGSGGSTSRGGLGFRGGNNNSNRMRGSNNHGDDDNNDGGNAVVCNCNEPALKLTVKKNGPNCGRQFFKCGADTSCNFFLWADADNSNLPNNNRQPVVPTAHAPFNKRTVMKDGPNKGRKFYCCGKPRDQQCRFFQWADDPGSGQAWSTTARGGGGQWRGGGRGNSRGGIGKKRKCGGCGQEGHTKRSCPFMK